MDKRRGLSLWGAVTLAGTMTLGCGVDKPSPSSGPTDVGTVQIALTASTPEGTTYRVEGAIFDIFNYSGACASFPCTSVPGDDPVVSVDLSPSVSPMDYAISLEDGWTVSRVAADGGETPVTATLLANFIPFTIKPNRTTPITFQFQIGDEVVTTGNGTAAVKAQFLETLIDDFEDGDGQLALQGGRNGQWTTFNDGTGIETPAPGGPVLPEVVDTTANEWLHLTGSGFGPAGVLLPDGVFSYGAGVFANFVVDPATGQGVPYNASAYSGVGFTFVAQFPANAPLILSFYVQTSATIPVANGGTCLGNCFDGFGVSGPVPYDPNGFTFTGVVPFAAMHQSGYGTPAVFDATTVMSVNWLVSFADNGQPLSSNVFDLKIDDVAFAPGGFAVPTTPTPDGGISPPPPPNLDGGSQPPPVDGGSPPPDFDGGPPPKPKPPVGPQALKASPGFSWR
jgi:hypothetical protein